MTGEEVITCGGEDVLSCVLAEFDESAFDDKFLQLWKEEEKGKVVDDGSIVVPRPSLNI